MVYAITDPFAPSFEQYINNRNFGVDPGSVCGNKGGPALSTCGMAGDLETEGIAFISADQSPNGKPMLAVSHELSDSTTFYRIDIVPEPSTLFISISLLGLFACERRHSRYVHQPPQI
jgi:hypothetical protein